MFPIGLRLPMSFRPNEACSAECVKKSTMPRVVDIRAVRCVNRTFRSYGTPWILDHGECIRSPSLASPSRKHLKLVRDAGLVDLRGMDSESFTDCVERFWST